MTMVRVSCPRDRRPPGAEPSAAARLLVFAMQREGFSFALREDRRGVLVRPGDRVSQRQRLVLRALFHEVRDLLMEPAS
jgi:hypothetical protein